MASVQEIKALKVYVWSGNGWLRRENYEIKALSNAYGLNAGSAIIQTHGRDFSIDESGTLIRALYGAKCVYMGFIHSGEWTYDPTTRSYQCSCQDIVSFLLERTHCGITGATQAICDELGNVVKIPISGICNAIYVRKHVTRRGTVYLWTPKDVIFDLYNHLPADIHQWIKLGDTSKLDYLSSLAESKMDISYDFSNATVLDAIRSVVACYGDITSRVRYDVNGNYAYIDFVRLGQESSGTKTIDVPNPGTCLTYGLGYDSNKAVISVNYSTNKDQLYDRIVLKSRNSPRCVMTFYSDEVVAKQGFESVVQNWRLEPAWDVGKIIPVNRSRFDKKLNQVVSWVVNMTVEDYVLIHGADAQKKDGDFYCPEAEFVFRRYKLPVWLNGNALLSVSKELPLPPNVYDQIENQDLKKYKTIQSRALIEYPAEAQASNLEYHAAEMQAHRVAYVQWYGWPEEYLWTDVDIPDGEEPKFGMCFCFGTAGMFGCPAQYLGQVTTWPSGGAILGSDGSGDGGSSSSGGSGGGYDGSGGYSGSTINPSDFPMWWKVDENKILKYYYTTPIEDNNFPINFGTHVKSIGFDINGPYIELNNPAIVPYLNTYRAGGGTRDIFRSAPFVLSLTVDSMADPLVYDTGLSPNTIEGISVLSESIGSVLQQTGDWELVTLGNHGLPYCFDESGTPIYSNFVIYQQEDNVLVDGFMYQSAPDNNPLVPNRVPFFWRDGQYIIKDDRSEMQRIAESVLKTSKQAARNITCIIPSIALSVKPADNVRLTGWVPDYYSGKCYTISTVDFDFEACTTTITASTQIQDMTNFYG